MKNTTNHHLPNSFFSQFIVVFLKGIDCQGKFNKHLEFLWNTHGKPCFLLTSRDHDATLKRSSSDDRSDGENTLIMKIKKLNGQDVIARSAVTKQSRRDCFATLAMTTR